MNKTKIRVLLFAACFYCSACLLYAQEAAQDFADTADEKIISVDDAASAQGQSAGPNLPSQDNSAEAVPSDNPANSSDSDLITVNFENVDIRDVVRILADKSGLNMVVGPDVAATVNLQLSNVSWERALDVILKTYNLTYKRDGDLVRIMTLEQLLQEDEKLPLQTKIITLNFARAAEINKNFASMLSSRGKIEINDRTNSLIITDIPDNIKRIEEISDQLDTRTPQVMIEALMADVVVTQSDQLGINWQLAQEQHGDGAKATSPDGGFNTNVAEKSIAQSLGALTTTGGIIKFGTTILADKDLSATIAFLQHQSRVNILAHPQILTLDNLAARIDLTEEIPYQQQTTSSQSSTTIQTTSFKSAGIALSVLPHITTKDNFIYMTIDVKQSFKSRDTTDGQPVIDSRSASTNLLVKNKETAVIGGLRKKNDTFGVSKLPILGDLPMVGALFRHRSKEISDTDLMIFITPTIVDKPVLTSREEEKLELFSESNETKDWNTVFRNEPKFSGTKTESMKMSDDGRPEDYFYLRPPALNKEAK